MIDIGYKLPPFTAKVQAILAQRDSGKTYLAGVEEEEFIKKELSFVVIDGMHAHYGLRSKYPIPVLGPIDEVEESFQPDIEIEIEDAKHIASLIIDHNLSCILDIANWDEDEQREFFTQFGQTLFMKNRTPRHIFVEEADVFAPQVLGGNKYARESRKVFNTLVRRGRGRGIGLTMITQRPQVIEKSVLNQASIYNILHVSGTAEMKAIKDLLNYYGLSKDELKITLEKILKFNQGDCMLYSPSYLKKMDIFKVRARETYHAGKTPEEEKKDNFNPIKINKLPIIDKLNMLQKLEDCECDNQ